MLQAVFISSAHDSSSLGQGQTIKGEDYSLIMTVLFLIVNEIPFLYNSWINCLNCAFNPSVNETPGMDINIDIISKHKGSKLNYIKDFK